jgi:hypothetical protein
MSYSNLLASVAIAWYQYCTGTSSTSSSIPVLKYQLASWYQPTLKFEVPLEFEL